MSLLFRTLKAFPRGRTTEELLVLVGAGFSHDKRLAALAELDDLLRDGHVERARDGKWRVASRRPGETAGDGSVHAGARPEQSPDHLVAAPAEFARMSASDEEQSPQDLDEAGATVDHQALLRYWRSALRADPRGATTQVVDKHGVEWILICGRGPITPSEGETLRLNIALDALTPSFREAIVRREGHDNALAIGWPMAVTRLRGVPAFQPVGLLSATWQRRDGNLVLSVDADDVLVNPDWLRHAARQTGWRRDALRELFDTEDGVGLHASDFLLNVKDAVASQIRGRLVGEDLVSRLDETTTGIFDAAALFLPADSSFTAGAARDLDTIATWPPEKIARTALAKVLCSASQADARDVAAINVGPLNAEQTMAVRNACSEALSVVTGPPGTGKSQAIVSMAASVLLSGGSVLVASKNHQALDAVEDRLGALAPDAPFVTRTLKPEEEIDAGFGDALKALIDRDHALRRGDLDDAMIDDLKVAARERSAAIDALAARAELECEIADLLEGIAYRERRGRQDLDHVTVAPALSPWRRLIAAILSRFSKGTDSPAETSDRLLHGASLSDLRRRLGNARASRDALNPVADPIELGERVQELAKAALPHAMDRRTAIGEERRQAIAERYDDWTFAGGRGHLPNDLSQAVLEHRPLWLASILGAPRRIPLDDGLFDLVIFDEASQCDIATAIPLFARAKKAVVVGDDQQLSFIAQLGCAQDRNLMQAQNLPVVKMARFAQSRRSLFDFASRVPDVPRVTLRHQYRSAGPIVEYISDNFYGGQLETSYDPNGLLLPMGAKPGLAWEHVPAPGIPQAGNVNPAEVSAIIRHLRLLLEEQDYQGSVGVITPFRAQVIALQEAVASIPEQKRVAADLKVGTVDGFQGQERDLILFSPCVGPRSPQSGLTFFQKDARRLNVAISRARGIAMIFGDLEFARSGTSRALRTLAARTTEPKRRSGEGVFDSDWERRVFYALKERGFDPEPQHEIAGRRLDFALFGTNGVKLDLEVDGRRWHQTPDGRRKTSDLWRDHQLESLGWRIRRFWVDELAKDMEGCIDIVERDLS
ncbi:AAA domain-containing protein [Rhodovulum sulfidophilum]|uniref:AAA domain-containing protein n=1 Tax=Rhodovulum sulfidophilum TaxID=35806 RepID=UPI001389D66C|nr:AAA domain-containing protein [Rhodovulum sulfidophilum]NDK36711.1 AAA family ATPase [Rhodovulum sulfidophilum]